MFFSLFFASCDKYIEYAAAASEEDGCVVYEGEIRSSSTGNSFTPLRLSHYSSFYYNNLYIQHPFPISVLTKGITAFSNSRQEGHFTREDE